MLTEGHYCRILRLDDIGQKMSSHPNNALHFPKEQDTFLKLQIKDFSYKLKKDFNHNWIILIDNKHVFTIVLSNLLP